MIVQVVFYPSEALDLSRAIRVDMIDLPDKIVSQQIPDEAKKLPEKKIDEPEPEDKKPEPPPIIKKETALPAQKEKPINDAVNINKSKSKQKEALAKLKMAAAMEKLKSEMTETKKAEERPKPVFKGRILSAGSSLSGLDKLQSDSYLSQLDSRIKSHWSLPQWLIGKPLRARVHIKFDESGHITFRRISQSSGNQTYDEYCLLAIEKATPLPQVPEKFSAVYKADGVVIGFPD